MGVFNFERSKVISGDCIEKMMDIPDKSIDMILCDLPYGQTARNKWDVVIPFDQLWEQYNRIIKDNGAIVLFANGLFTVDLMNSNRKNWKYNLVWDKVLASGHLNANRMPMRLHEDICVFYKKSPTYNPQKVLGKKSHSVGNTVDKKDETNTNYNSYKAIDTEGNLKHPKSILTFSKTHPSKSLHPTEKPVLLLEWMVKSFTNPGEIVLDNTAGSGSTGEACINTERDFLLIEKEEKYINIIEERLNPLMIDRGLSLKLI